MRKFLIAALPCLVLGLAGPAFAEGAAPHDGGLRTGTTTVGDTAGVGTVTADGQRFVGDAQGVSGATGGPAPVVAGRDVGAALGDARVDRCPLGAILAGDCVQRN